MDLGVRGKVAVITGGDSGIGLETAKVRAAEGAHIVLTDIDLGQLREATKAVAAVKAPGVEIETTAVDLRDDQQVIAFADNVKTHFGKADMLGHFAGARGAAGDFLSLSDADWLETIQIDLLGAVRVCRAFLPQMMHAGWGRILLTASENAVQPYIEETPYNACKAAVINLAKGLSKAYSGRGVLINVISPAYIETPMTDAMMDELARQRGTDRAEAVRWFLEHERPGITLQRRGRADEVAAVAAMMLSERASFVNGCNWRVDGGAVMTV